MFCILCEAKMKAVKVLAGALKIAKESNKRQSASLGRLIMMEIMSRRCLKTEIKTRS